MDQAINSLIVKQQRYGMLMRSKARGTMITATFQLTPRAFNPYVTRKNFDGFGWTGTPRRLVKHILNIITVAPKHVAGDAADRLIKCSLS